jgi:hypothetical protein
MKKPGKKGNQRNPLTSQGEPQKTGKQANMGNFTLFFIPLRNPPKKAHIHSTPIYHTITEQIYGETPQKGTLLRVSKMGLKVW